MRSPQAELASPQYEDLMAEFYNEESSAPWYVAVRAVEEFREKHGGVYPGLREEDIEGDFAEVRGYVDAIMGEVNPDKEEGIKVEDKYVREMLRFSGSKLHNVSAVLGGIASQEAIKVLIRQYTPINHTLIYDGIHGRAQVFNI